MSPVTPFPSRSTERLLNPSEVALASSIAEMSEPVLITRANLESPGPTIVAVSPGMLELTGYAAHELLGRNPRIFQGPLTDRAVLARLRATCSRGEHFVGEVVNYRKDGTPYIHEFIIDPIRNDDGQVTHYFSLHRDTTAQRPFAQEWLAAEERAHAALEHATLQMRMIAEAIIVLESTKRSVQSKELATLRKRLAAVEQAFTAGIKPSWNPAKKG